jgi:Zn-dependent protease with chaperone function
VLTDRCCGGATRGILAYAVGIVVAPSAVRRPFPCWTKRHDETEAGLEAAGVAGSRVMMSVLKKMATLNPTPLERRSVFSTHPSVQDRIQILSG